MTVAETGHQHNPRTALSHVDAALFSWQCEAVHLTPRQRAREQTLRDITRIGREQLTSAGAAALSVRAVARDLGVSSSAVYRYVKSRNELLDVLLVDGATELGDAVDEAVGSVVGSREKFRALGRAARAWALREPARYALIFGGPAPGCDAPDERTSIPGTPVLYSLLRILDDAYRNGQLTDGGQPAHETLAAELGHVRTELEISLPEHLLARGVLVWSSLFGAVSFEVFGVYGPDTFSDPGRLFEHHLTVLAAIAGLEVHPE